MGVPPKGWEEKESLQKTREEGVPTDINYISAFANLAARRIEKAIEEGGEVKVRVPIVESLGDINLELESPARRYITTTIRK